MECPICGGIMENGHCWQCGFCYGLGMKRGLVNPYKKYKVRKYNGR